METELYKWKKTDCTGSGLQFLFSTVSLVKKVSHSPGRREATLIFIHPVRFLDPPRVKSWFTGYLSETRASQIKILLSRGNSIHGPPRFCINAKLITLATRNFKLSSGFHWHLLHLIGEGWWAISSDDGKWKKDSFSGAGSSQYVCQRLSWMNFSVFGGCHVELSENWTQQKLIMVQI